MIKETRVYETEDGKRFDNREDAEAWDATLNLAKELENSDLYFSNNSAQPEELAMWLKERYHLIPIEKKK